MNTIELLNITLVCVDTVNHGLALKAIQRCQEKIKFGHALFFTNRPIVDQANVECIQITHVQDIESYSRFILQDLNQYVLTSHVLLMQWDGFVIHPNNWRSNFLDYDYIGATWPACNATPEMVGNGGFSLRSKKLLQALSEINFEHFHPEDEQIARTHRAALESKGIRFAPVEIADQFAYEFKSPARATFGFHGFSNFPDFMSTDELHEFIRHLPNGIVFNNYFLGFAQKALAKDAGNSTAINLRDALLKQIECQILESPTDKALSSQGKHLLSGLHRLKLSSPARLLAKKRLLAQPSLTNVRLLLKTLIHP